MHSKQPTLYALSFVAVLLLTVGSLAADDLETRPLSTSWGQESEVNQSPVPAPSYFVHVVESCCESQGATLAVDCEQGGSEWVCRAIVVKDDLFGTTKKADLGWEHSKLSNQDGQCIYRSPVCGDNIFTCKWEAQPTTLVCLGKYPDGELCNAAVPMEP